MANCRNVQMAFWTDSKLLDEFTPEDKYFYCYLLTNPFTRLCGCYEVSIGEMARQLGLSKDSIERLLERFETYHQVLLYSRETKEVLLLNWYKYNWQGGKQLQGVENEIKTVKNPEFKRILEDLLTRKTEDSDTPYIPHRYPIDTPCMGYHTLSINSLDNIKDMKHSKDPKKTNNVINNSINNINNINHTKTKHKYGEYKHVQLTDEQYKKLQEDLGQERLDQSIKILDEYCEVSGRTYKNYNLVIRGWVQEKLNKTCPKTTESRENKVTQEQLNELRRNFGYGDK